MDNLDTVVNNTEEEVKMELNNIYNMLSIEYNSENRLGILSDLKYLINKITLSQNEKN